MGVVEFVLFVLEWGAISYGLPGSPVWKFFVSWFEIPLKCVSCIWFFVGKALGFVGFSYCSYCFRIVRFVFVFFVLFELDFVCGALLSLSRQ